MIPFSLTIPLVSLKRSKNYDIVVEYVEFVMKYYS